MKRFALHTISAFAAIAANAETVLFDFEAETERNAVPIRSGGDYAVSVTNAFALSGEWALRLEQRPMKSLDACWPSFTLKSHVADWRDYDRLVVELYTFRDTPDGRLWMKISSKGNSVNKSGLHGETKLPAHGYRQWIVPLSKWPKGTDPSNIEHIHIATAAWCQGNAGQVFHIDRLSLLKKGEPLPVPQGPCWVRDILPAMLGERDAVAATNALLRAEANHAMDYALMCAASDSSKFSSDQMALGWATSMEKVMPRDSFPWRAIPSDGLKVRLARNECESVQLLVAPKNGGLSNVTVRAEGGFAANVAVAPMGYVNITKTPPYKVGCNAPTDTAPGYTRLTRDPKKGWWPDPILGFLGGVDVAGKDVQSFWIRVRCPEDQSAGEYKGSIVAAADGVGSVRIPFVVRVNDFTLGRESPLPLAVSFAAWPNRGPQTPAAMWQRHKDEWVDFLADYYITMHHLYSGGDVSVLERLKREERLGLYNLCYWKPPASTNEADMAKWRTTTIAAVQKNYETMKMHGILDHAYLYGCDEAPKEKLQAIRLAVKELKETAPGVPVSTTAYDDDFGVGTSLDVVDWFTPLTPKYDVEKAKASRALGHHVWWYICMSPKAPYANMFIECPAIEGRVLMGAQTAKYRPDGFLYYATAIWHSKRCIEFGPFTDWEPRSFEAYHGDGSWVCAGPDGIPVPTIRLENFRDGLEDYAYAKLLEEKLRAVESGKCKVRSDGGVWISRAKAALDVPREVVDSMTNYTDNPAVLYRWRDEMADLIEGAK